MKTALDAFGLVLGPQERLTDFELTSHRRGSHWIVPFAAATTNMAGGGIEDTVDADGERVLETIGGP
jgi:hypothetical protein